MHMGEQERKTAQVNPEKEYAQYDLVVIGGGPGGYEAALEAAGVYGLKTALVEKEKLGGTCLNHGCIPTKSLLHSADLYRQMLDCERFGVGAQNVSFDWTEIQNRKDSVVDQLRSGIAAQMKQKKIDVVYGIGRILDPHSVEIIFPAEESQAGIPATIAAASESPSKQEKQVLHTRFILIATGSKAAMPPIKGADLENVMTSDELLEKKDGLFDRLLIIGGGVIGVEFASVFSVFGTQVTILEALPRVIANMDKELSQSLKMLLKKRGVDIHTGALVQEIRRKDGGNGALECVYLEKEKECLAETDGILICTGRRPYTEGLFAEECQMPEMERGRILTDEYQQTSIPVVYAIGDTTGGFMLAHAATAMGRNAVAHMQAQLSGEEYKERVLLSAIPACIYTDPEIACVGMTQDQAKEAGIEAESRKAVTGANGKSVISGQERGFVKVVYEKETGKILGAQMMCARASDMISEFTQAITEGLTMEDMHHIVRPHPTFEEIVTEACTRG